MNYLFHEGGKYKKTNSKSSSKTKKGGNFLGSIGELVAPTGWESFVTTAGLFALDRADAALRREKKEKKNTMKGGHKSKAEKEKMRRFREIMGWKLIQGSNSYNRDQSPFMAGDTVNSSKKKIIFYPNDDLINYIIEQDKIHEYKTPISVELFKQLESNFKNIMNNIKKEQEELNKIQLAKNEEKMLKQALIRQEEIQRTERNLEKLQTQYEQALLVAEQFASEAREAQKRVDDSILVARKAEQEIQFAQQKLYNMRK